MSVIQITSRDLMHSFKKMMTQIIHGDLVCFTYKGRVFEIVEKKPETSGQKMSALLNKELQENNFHPGDLVWEKGNKGLDSMYKNKEWNVWK